MARTRDPAVDRAIEAATLRLLSTAGAITLFLATHFGIPVSTTHTITGAIIGVGSSTRLSAVRWGVARGIVVAWILTIPAASFVAASIVWTFKLTHLIT